MGYKRSLHEALRHWMIRRSLQGVQLRQAEEKVSSTTIARGLPRNAAPTSLDSISEATTATSSTLDDDDCACPHHDGAALTPSCDTATTTPTRPPPRRFALARRVGHRRPRRTQDDKSKILSHSSHSLSSSNAPSWDKTKTLTLHEYRPRKVPLEFPSHQPVVLVTRTDNTTTTQPSGSDSRRRHPGWTHISI